jgi:hypothetical protein
MFHIFTFSTDENRLIYLKQTEQNNGIKYIIRESWGGFVDKITNMQNAINNIPDDDIVCFIDGYDVLVNASNTDILNNFKSYECDLLISTEINCFPWYYRDDMDRNNTNHENNYKYVNSGGYIGYAKAVNDWLFWKEYDEIVRICANGNNSGDQSYLTEYYIHNHKIKNIKLDIYCKIFQSMYFVPWNDIVFKNGFVYNKILDVNPCFIHFNGQSNKTNNGENIMPIFVKNIEESKNNNNHEINLNEYTQSTIPHNQK